jgi:hypothetical protein
MTANVVPLPLRSLDSQKEKAIEAFYKPSFGPGLFLSTFLPVTLGLSLGGAFFSIGYGLLAGVIVSVCLLILRQTNYRKKAYRARYVYQYGSEGELVFTGIANNYGYKVNGMPQQVLSLLFNGSPVQIKTFSSKILTVYTLPRQAAYVHPQYKDTMVPAGIFQLQMPPQGKSLGKIFRRSLIFLIPFAFVFGLTFFINGEMSSHSHSDAQPDALFYRQGEKLVLASVVTHFQANKVSGNSVWGSDNCYAVGVDAGTGKYLWKVDFHGKNDEGRDVGAARLLGQSDKYLFFLRNELYVIDKETGKLAARNNDFPAIKDKMIRAQVANYEDDASFIYSDSLKAVIVKGADGLFYTIDGITLKTGTIDIPDPNDFFKNKFKYGNNYEDHITSMFDDGHRCMALLDAKDTLLLAHDHHGFEQRAASESIRRMLYACPSDSSDGDWTVQNSSAFLFGGFLTDDRQVLHSPIDSISKFVSYQDLLTRYVSIHPPMRTNSGGFLLLHRTTIERNALVQLTGISSRGSTLWQINTDYPEIPLLYHDSEKDELYLGGNTRGDNSDQVNQVTEIDLKTGSTRKFAIK